MGYLKNFSRLVKFEHTIFSLPFALLGFFIAIAKAEYTFNWISLFYILLCMIFARNAAMGFNRYIDRKIDAKNPRTSGREIPKGIISSKNALIFVIVNSLLFIATTYLINDICFYLSPVALLVILGYSFTKRFTALCHFVLSLGLSIAPMGAWMAVTGTWSWMIFLFSGVVFFWVSGFDVIYSLQDESFDYEEKLFSIPSRYGKKRALQIARVIHLLCAIILTIAIIQFQFSWIGYIGYIGFITLLIYQNSIVNANDLSRVNLAFGTTNGIASIFLCAFLIIDLLVH